MTEIENESIKNEEKEFKTKNKVIRDWITMN
jgi:hypothetical protein